MSEKGNRYALAALKKKRSTIAGEIETLKRQVRHKEEQLVHLDETIRLLDPSVNVEALPVAYRRRHVTLFRQGELSRLTRDILRRAGKPLTTPEIVTALLEATGNDEAARPAMARRVTSNLNYLKKRGDVVPGEMRKGSRNWTLK